GQPKSNTSSAGFSALIRIHGSGRIAITARMWATTGRTLLLIEATSSGEAEHQGGADDEDRDDHGGQRGGVPHVVEGEGLLVDVEHDRAGRARRTALGQHEDQA